MRIASKKLSQRIINASFAFILALSTATASLPFIGSDNANALPFTTYRLKPSAAVINAEAGTGVGSLYTFVEWKSFIGGWNDFQASLGSAAITATATGGAEVSKDSTNWSSSETVETSKSVWNKVEGSFYLKSDTVGTFPINLSATIVTTEGVRTLNKTINLVASDSTAPVVTHMSQDYEVHNGVQGRYAVTLTFNEAIDTTSLEQGWYEIAGSNKTQFTKIFYTPKQYTANFKDLAGNAVEYTFTVSPVANDSPVISFVAPTPTEGSLVKGTITPHVTATDDYGMGGYYIRLWKGAFESGTENLVYNGCYSAPGAFLLGTSQDVACSAIDTTTLADGKYVLSAQFHDGNGAWGQALRTIYVDNTAPTAPTITSPGAHTWHKSAPIVNQWSAATDANGISHYQIAYNYDDGHSFGGDNTCPGVTIAGVSGFIGCRNVNGLSRSHQPNVSEQGGVTIWVRAVDNAGNVGPWSKSVHYYYDSTVPETTLIAPVGVVNGDFIVSGDATDNLSLNRVYVQLVNRQDNKRYGGTTINLIGEGKSAHWSKTFDIASLNLPDGDYAAHVSVVDMAGNTSSVGWTDNFTLDTAAKVTGNYFVAMSNELNVGFTVSNLNNNAEKVEVALYDADGNLITKNVGDSQQMIDLLNSNPDEISSPFWMPAQGDTDGWWTFGNPNWKSVNKPSYAVVTVYYEGGKTAVSDPISFISPSESGYTWETLLANLPSDNTGSDDESETPDQSNDDEQSNSGNDDENSQDGAPVDGDDEGAGDQNQSGQGDEAGQSEESQGSTDDAAEGEDVKGTQTTSEPEVKGVSDSNVWTLAGLAWYWWLLVLAILAFIGGLIAALRRRHQEND